MQTHVSLSSDASLCSEAVCGSFFLVEISVVGGQMSPFMDSSFFSEVDLFAAKYIHSDAHMHTRTYFSCRAMWCFILNLLHLASYTAFPFPRQSTNLFC